MTPLEIGAELAKMGLKVVPVHHPVKRGNAVICSCKKGADCRSVAKHPMPNEWQKGASSNRDLIATWVKAFPKANLGVVTGVASGIFVLDIDPRHGGLDTLDSLQVKNGKLPDTAMVMTGGGGYHYYFKHPGGQVKNSAGIVGQGIDVRGENGFVVGPGSIHSSGGIYDWEGSSTPEESGFQPAPDWLIESMSEAPQKAPLQVADQTNGVCEGGRNVWLASIAGALRCRGCDYMALFQMLLIANELHCKPQLSTDEVESVAKSYAKLPVGYRTKQ